MLQQWEADILLHARKVYSASTCVRLERGADQDYPVETDDGTEHFLLDVWRPTRNPRKARFQLRYRREIVLARLCTSVPHLNPDGKRLGFPHLHLYQEPDDDKWATELDPFDDIASALVEFCNRVNLPVPDIQGGLS